MLHLLDIILITINLKTRKSKCEVSIEIDSAQVKRITFFYCRFNKKIGWLPIINKRYKINRQIIKWNVPPNCKKNNVWDVFCLFK